MPETNKYIATPLYIVSDHTHHTLSNISGLLVAAIIITLLRDTSPFISVNNCAKTRSPTLDPSLIIIIIIIDQLI